MIDNADRFVAAPGGNLSGSGALTYWRLGGAVNLDDLHDRWSEQGLDPRLLPELPSPAKALRRAVREQEERGVFARQAVGGWVLVEQHEDERHVEFTTRLYVGMNAAHALTFRAGESALSQRLDHHPGAERISEAYVRHLNSITSADLGQWLAGELVEMVHAVSLRETGGFYFIPPSRLTLWRAMRSAIESASDVRIGLIPALENAGDQDLVRSVLDAVTADAERTAKEIATDLDTGELGLRALENRQDRCHEARRKLESFRVLLGQQIDSIAERFTELEAREIAVAISKLDAEDTNNK